VVQAVLAVEHGAGVLVVVAVARAILGL
jgi:hypothetical protein